MRVKLENSIGLLFVIPWLFIAPFFINLLLYSTHSFANDNSFTKNNPPNKGAFYNNVLNEQERQWLQSHGNIRLGVDHAWPPFEFFNKDKKYSGLASGYIDIIQDKLAINMVPLFIESWSEVVDKAKVKQIDVLPAVAITPERREYLNFTDAYITFPGVIATNIQAPYINNLKDLVGLKVGVVKSYYTHESLSRDYPELTLVPTTTLDEALLALSNSEIDAVVDNLAAITYSLRKLQIETIKIAAPTEYNFELHMGVRNDWPELVSILNKALNQISSEQRSEISNKWISYHFDLGARIKTVLIWLSPFLFGLLLILYIYARWNKKLKQEIVERLKTEQELKKLTTAVEQNPVSIIITDTKGNIEYVNPKFSDVSGYSQEELIGKNTRVFKTGHTSSKEYSELWGTLKNGKIWSGEFYNRKKDGTMYWEQTTICPIKNETGEIINFVAVKEDITSRKEDEALILKQATTDALTGLPNRTLFLDRLDQEIELSKRQDHIFAILYIDLDNFKKINDTMGHAVGDEFLIKISQRFQSCIRSSDTLSRLGGDEFVILLRDIESAESVETIAKKLLNSLDKHIFLNHTKLYASCSIGISLFPADAKNSDKIIRHADMAMYRAKELGRNNYQFYSAEINEKTARQNQTEYELRKAIANNEFLLYYQPIICLEKNTIDKVEVLLRWAHPSHGILTPDKFISIAEDTGLIVRMGEHVLEQAFSDFNDFKKHSSSLKDIAVNCSPRQFQNAGFSNFVEKMIQNSNIRSDEVTLEITENLFINAEDSFSVSSMEYLRKQGIKASLDDFGTGYSSLGYLKRFPVDILKIDKSFLHDVIENPNAQQLVDTIIKMGHALNLQVIAEGIENFETAKLLKTMHCDYAQGFYYARPLPKEKFIVFLNEYQDTEDIDNIQKLNVIRKKICD